jgi:glycosyltransferase involved in cell wall biosynthesis
MTGQVADVCILVEGAYPYVSGGVSTWIHSMMTAQRHLTFHVVALVAKKDLPKPKYTLPDNVIELRHIYLQELDRGIRRLKGVDKLYHSIEDSLLMLQSKQGGLQQIRDLVSLLSPYKGQLALEVLLNSDVAWNALVRMYEASIPEGSFINYFWTWRSLCSGLFSALCSPLPQARVYHAISTGYAGLLAARAKIETRRPVILTEHGIYTNERRLEITMADWLSEGMEEGLSIKKPNHDLRDIWNDTFASYARACYGACDRIITLFSNNQVLQRRDGADPDKMIVIPNGVDFENYAAIPRSSVPHPPTVAFIGRVVPIKDVKTYIRACAILRDDIPELEVYILGPIDEDKDYHRECLELANDLNLSNTLRFMGQVRIEEYLSRIDVIALTSLSEAQPLTILEAGAAGVPTVATDVGACREIILGSAQEIPALGPGGKVTALASPSATAMALKSLLLDNDKRERYGKAIQRRVQLYYNKVRINATYSDLYNEMHCAQEQSVSPEAIS